MGFIISLWIEQRFACSSVILGLLCWMRNIQLTSLRALVLQNWWTKRMPAKWVGGRGGQTDLRVLVLSQRRVASQQFYAFVLDLGDLPEIITLTIYFYLHVFYLTMSGFVCLCSSKADNTTKGSKVFAGVRTSVLFSDTSKILLNKPLQTLMNYVFEGKLSTVEMLFFFFTVHSEHISWLVKISFSLELLVFRCSTPNMYQYVHGDC